MKHWYTNAIVLSSLLVFNMIIYSIVMFAIVTIRKDTTIRRWEVNKVHISNLISYQAMPSVVSVNVRQSVPLSYSSKGTTRAHKRGSVRQKQARRAGTSNYIQQYPWDVITCPCPSWLLLARTEFLDSYRHTTYPIEYTDCCLCFVLLRLYHQCYPGFIWSIYPFPVHTVK